MAEDNKKDIRVSYITYEQYVDYEYVDVANYFIVNALQQYVYFHTNDRNAAQQKCNELFGPSKYTVKASKISNTKSKLESGGLSCTGTSTRRGQKR